MPHETLTVAPGPEKRIVRDQNGKLLRVPKGWKLLPPGDAGLTRRVKAAGPTWTVKEKKGRRVFSQGVWASAEQINSAREILEVERNSDAYRRKRESALRSREKKQTEYVNDFREAVLKFLRFDSQHAELADQMADAVTKHATPVGSGTVARTKQISIERRAESAVIAWMRHQTTSYDQMRIPRERGRRREVRRMLAGRSRQLLDKYRKPNSTAPRNCPIIKALQIPVKPS